MRRGLLLALAASACSLETPNVIPQAGFTTETSTIPEHDPGTLVVELDRPWHEEIQVEYQLAGSAAPGVDYTLESGSLTFAPGVTRQALPLGVLDNERDEGDRDLVVILLGRFVGPTRAQHVVTIADDDAPPRVAFAAAQSAALRDAGEVEVVVELERESGRPIEVAFAVNPSGSAVAGADYTLLATSPLTFPPGTRAQPIRVQIIGASLPDRTLVLDLVGAPLNAELGAPASDALSIIDQGTCLGSGGYAACLPSPTASRTLGGTLNTDTSALCSTVQPADWAAAGQPASCFVVATSITTTSAVSVTGGRPLVLFATGTITLSHDLDAASHRNGTTGPAGAQACGVATSAQGASRGGGGGAGASFLTRGGDGGRADDNALQGGTAAAASAVPTRLRGGCTGGQGGTTSGGNGGGGGGGVYIVSGNAINISGIAINVSGAGGARAASGSRGGGGGGGSGGMLKLDAPSITFNVSTRLVANGGGGGSGAGGGGSSDGADPSKATPTAQASGGTGSGGTGGRGFAGLLAATAGANGNNLEGGGGGGGGGGYVQSSRALNGAIISAGRFDGP